MRENRSAAVTATRGGERLRRDKGRREGGFNAKTRDMSKTDVGSYSVNGPAIALLA